MYDVAIIGAGISGAAVAFELSKYNLKTVIIEKCNDVSCGATKANSAIIHAGYDPKPGSLMAKLNVRGAKLAKELCPKLDVPYKQCGAMVVAFDEEQIYTLEQLESQAKINGVEGCQIISGDKARELEPNLSKDVCSALYVPTSAIVCPWDLCLALVETAMKNGTELLLNSEVKSITREDNKYLIKAGRKTVKASYVVNAGGVYADKIHDMVAPHDFTMVPSVGQYYLLDKPEGKRVSHTIFQCPDDEGKGVLVTPTVHGNLLVGPNIKVVEGEDTSTDANSLKYVKTAGSKSVPSIDFSQNIRNYAGVRARTDKHDFIIREVPEAPHFIDCAGICSPGLASSLAIGEYVASLLEKASLSLDPRDNFVCDRSRIRFNELSVEEKQKLVEEHPAYGHVICRCNTITEGEILDAFHGPVPPRSLDGVKRRVGSSMGRCQGGFCSTQIMKIISEQLGIPEDEIPMDERGSWMLTKGGNLNV